MASITIDNLSKSYGANSDIPAVRGLNISVPDGTFLTLLGPSGCGKTTTLRLIAGYITPDTGSISVGTREVSSSKGVVSPDARGMGMVFQNYAVWPHKTVYENVSFGLNLRKLKTHEVKDKVAKSLEQVNLLGFENRYPNELSGGQQQRVALARSLVVEPEILLLDEPLSNLDAKLREKMRIELKALQRRTGITFVYVTHDQAEALALSDQIVVMQLGEVQQIGSPREVYQQPANRRVADFMGLVNILSVELTQHGSINTEGLLADGTKLIIPNHKLPSQAKKLDLVLRPENLTLSLSPHPSAILKGLVSERTFLGNICEYFVELPSGESLRIQSHPSETIDVGSQVHVGFSLDAASFFAAA